MEQIRVDAGRIQTCRLALNPQGSVIRRNRFAIEQALFDRIYQVARLSRFQKRRFEHGRIDNLGMKLARSCACRLFEVGGRIHVSLLKKVNYISFYYTTLTCCPGEG